MGIPGGPNPLLMRRAAAADDAYQIEKSLRFNDDDSPGLLKDLTRSGNRCTWTWSGWIKKSGQGSYQTPYGYNNPNGAHGHQLRINNDDTLQWFQFDNPNFTHIKTTHLKLRDPSAWFHVVTAFDTTQATASERMKLYINGVRITSFSTSTDPAQNAQGTAINRTGYQQGIGRPGHWSGNYLDGYLADVYFIDGLQLGPSAFAEYSSSGAWVPKAFAVPTPNDGSTWSSKLYTSGSTYNGSSTNQTFNSSPNAATAAFDGNAATYAQNNEGSPYANWIYFRPAGGITGIQTLRVWTQYVSNFRLNGVESRISPGTQGYNSGAWYDFPASEIPDTLTELAIQGSNHSGNASSGRFGTVEINGVYLVDGQTDKTYEEEKAVTYLNNGTTFSSTRGAAFDGVATTDSAGDASFTGANGSYTITFGEGGSSGSGAGAITVSSSLKLQMYASIASFDTYCDVEINGSETTMSVDTSQGNQAGIYASNFTGSMTSLKVTAKGGANIGIAQIIVDGTILINDRNEGVGTNSYHLKFNDVTTNAALGYSAFDPDFSESHVDKGGPILKTNSRGDTVTSGTNTDSDSSNLKLAIAGNAFTDSSGNSVSVTATNATISTAQSKFYGSSINFDVSSTNQWVTTAGSLWSANGDQTFEAWIWPNDFNQIRTIFHTGGVGKLAVHSTGAIRLYADNSNYTETTPKITVQKWTHIALVQTSNNRKIYINGVSVAFDGGAGNAHTAAWDTPGGTLAIGDDTDIYYFSGHMNDIRVYNKAKYTSNFLIADHGDWTPSNLTHDDNTSGSVTVSTATGGRPIYATNAFGDTKDSPVAYRTDSSAGTTSGTGLVLAVPGDTVASTACDVHQEINSNSSNKSASANNGTAVSTDYDKYYSSGAINFDGTDDTLSFGASADFNFGSGNVTVECWLYLDAHAGDKCVVGIWTGWQLAIGAGSGLDKFAFMMFDGSSVSEALSSVGSAGYVGQWVHLAGVREGNTLKIYVDGVEKGSASFTGSCSNTSGGTLYIGGRSSGHNINGRIQDLRIYKGVAKYTSNFQLIDDQRDASLLDSYTDTPTNYEDDSGGIHGNYCTWNPLNKTGSSNTLSQGNLKCVTTTNACTKGTFSMTSGKWYFEYTLGSSATQQIGIIDGNGTQDASAPGGSGHNGYIYLTTTGSVNTGHLYHNGSASISTWPSGAEADIVQIAYDADTGKLWWGKNNTWFNDSSGNTGNPATGANPAITVASAYRNQMVPVCGAGGGSDAANGNVNFGQRAYKYTAPSDFKALCTQNLDDTFSGADVNDPSKFFDILTYVGQGTDDSNVDTQTVSGLSFQPDLIWIKNRDHSDGWHHISDVIRGPSEALYSNGNHASTSNTNKETTPTSNGFTLEDGNGSRDHMYGSTNYAAWCWDAGTAAVTASSDGSITPSAQWVNATAGFSISKYTGTGNAATIGHGLGAVPEFIIVKRLNTTAYWECYHKVTGATHVLYLNTDDVATDTQNPWNDTAPTDEVFSVWNSSGTNGSNDTYISYCFAPISGYSHFTSYVGNASADGPFVYCGFRPKWVLVKNTDAGGPSNSGRNWNIRDTARDNDNPVKNYLLADATNGGYTYEGSTQERFIDVLANGFKVRSAVGSGDALYTPNVNGDRYIVAAFAEFPFKTARAR